jgi:hypothetical protein
MLNKNGFVHGFEIKSATDTLARLPQQLMFYEECLEKLTIVCAEKHVSPHEGGAPGNPLFQISRRESPWRRFIRDNSRGPLLPQRFSPNPRWDWPKDTLSARR